MSIPSFIHKSFADVYDEFLFACSHGDCLTVERLLQTNSIRRNEISMAIGQGKFSAIVLTIEHNQIEVMKILLNYLPYNDFREALLLAIYLDLTKIAQLIIEHNTFKCFYGTYADWQRDIVDAHDDSHFAAIRPIHLAAQCNRTTILYELLKLGERITAPHPIQCQCNPCISAGLTDSLRYSQLRLAIYRALSSDVYLALVSPDPIATAFELSRELRQLIKSEANLSAEYLQLFKQVSNFTARLLDHLQNEKEAEVLLTAERIQSALEYQQREFVIHNATQQRLTDLIYNGSGMSENATIWKKLMMFISYFLGFLPMYIGNFWLPDFVGKYCRWFFEPPAISIVLSGGLYFLFLILLIFTGTMKPKTISLREEYPRIYNYSTELIFNEGATLPYLQNEILPPLRLLMLIWMFAFAYRNIRRMIRTRSLLGLITFVMTIIFLLYLILLLSTTIEFYIDWNYLLDEQRWIRLKQFSENNSTTEEYREMQEEMKGTIFYLGRYSYVNSIDLQRATDGVMSLAIVVSVFYACIFLFNGRDVGPLIVSLIITSRFIGLLFIYFLITIVAYEVSCLRLFAPYMNGLRYGIDTERIPRAAITKSFDNLRRLTIFVFFSVFGIAKNELTQNFDSIDSKEIRNSSNTTTYYYLNPFTRWIGSITYGYFAFATRIVYLSIITAFTKRSYGVSLRQATANWLYARTGILLAYIMHSMDVLPPPFNIIITPKRLLQLFEKKKSAKQMNERENSPVLFLRQLDRQKWKNKDSSRLTLDEVLNRIVHRYLTKYHPLDALSQKRQRQIEQREELAAIRRAIVAEIQLIYQANEIMKKHISTIFFDLKELK